ncbi:MAG: complex I NDUFA9 subunit family protein [Pseudomonadota bacterium]
MNSNHPTRLITIFGGSGFVGRHLTRALAKRGYRVRAAVRRPDLAGHLQPLGNVSQIAAVQANLRYPWSVEQAAQGSDLIINLVAILYETGRQTFSAVQEAGAAAVAKTAKDLNVPLVHISAIGADTEAGSDYARTKGMAEKRVRELVPDATIVRPSIIFGPEDEFFNKFAEMSRLSPALPMIGGGHTKFQPVFVGDVAEAIARIVDDHFDEGETAGKTYELGGPEVASFRECMEKMLDIIDRKRVLATIPFGVARAMGSVMQFAPKPPLTPDQVRLLESDNVVGGDAKRENRTLEGLGIAPRTMASVLPSYLVRFRPRGQYEIDRGI